MVVTIESILAALAALLPNLESLIQNVITANTSKDQAALDAAHAQLIAVANSLRPAGTNPVV